ncbi:MAG: tetratricopeptide repeat protein [Spirochaetes bacterium]|jgi:putative GTP pyrophosphokinase|nr:tetratricopeptide repeat protein [Spirochaetota bacterium]
MKNKQINYWLENKHQLYSDYESRLQSYYSVLEFMTKKLEGVISESGIKALVKGRIKDFDALLRKLLIKSQATVIDDPFEKITDIIGLRIVVPFFEDIKLIESLIKKSFGVVEIDYKSLDLSIKEFGYDSTHILVEVPEGIEDIEVPPASMVSEIQLRTILQEAWAEVEHELVYKTNLDNIEDNMKRKLIALKATLSLADTTFQELRDFQKKKIHDLDERHKKLLDKVSTIPEQSGGGPEVRLESIRGNAIKGSGYDSEMNDLYFEALNAHLDNKLEKAMHLYTHLIMIAPNHYLYNHRGLVYFSLSEYEKAVDDFTEAIKIEPNDTRVFTNRGLAYRMLKQYDSAVADFNKSLEINPLWPDTFYGRALTRFDMGDVRAALEDIDKAIKLNPEFKQAFRFKQYLLNQRFE